MGRGVFFDGRWSCDCSPPRTAFRRVAKDNRAYYSCPLKFQDKSRCNFFIYEDSPEFAARTGSTTVPQPATPSRPASYHSVGAQSSPHTPGRQLNLSQESSTTVDNDDEFDDPELDKVMSSVDESLLTPSKRRRVEEPTTPTPSTAGLQQVGQAAGLHESSYESRFVKNQTSSIGISHLSNKLDYPTKMYGDAHEMMKAHWKELLDEGSRYGALRLVATTLTHRT
ncbi:hypothetical protein V1525DRAFT_414782 [Lipomyces kononenkoae]|uniref:Uncharacterized protein n=1 Tax=Lipomyces kononenkoae TaxID=34357 RepID=A0ACC3SRE6_LIPKO